MDIIYHLDWEELVFMKIIYVDHDNKCPNTRVYLMSSEILKRLRDVGLITSTRDGNLTYSLTEQGIQAYNQNLLS